MTDVRDLQYDPVLRDLVQEARRNLAGRRLQTVEDLDDIRTPVMPDAPDGKLCAACKRRFHAAAEYLCCKACDAVVCRKGDCKHLHHADHRVAFLKQQTTEAA